MDARQRGGGDALHGHDVADLCAVGLNHHRVARIVGFARIDSPVSVAPVAPMG